MAGRIRGRRVGSRLLMKIKASLQKTSKSCRWKQLRCVGCNKVVLKISSVGRDGTCPTLTNTLAILLPEPKPAEPLLAGECAIKPSPARTNKGNKCSSVDQVPLHNTDNMIIIHSTIQAKNGVVSETCKATSAPVASTSVIVILPNNTRSPHEFVVRPPAI